MSNVRVCVDVVGGDEKPQVVLDGIEAALAADPDIEVIAVGPADIVNPFAAAHARVEALEAPDVIAMDDDPIRAVMTKRKSSMPCCLMTPPRLSVPVVRLWTKRRPRARRCWWRVV